MNHKISILIPVFNVAKYIEKCLISLFENSIISQCEIIIVNDCSTDNSVEIINKILQNYPDLQKNVFIYNNEKNSGSAATRNILLSHAKGEYILFVDSDDWLEKDYIECLYNEAQKTDAQITGCDVYIEWPEKTEYRIHKLDNDGITCIDSMLKVITSGWLWNKLIKREIIVQNNINFVEGINILEDLIFCIKCYFCVNRIAYINKPLYHYNRRSDSYMGTLTDNKKAETIINAVSVIEKVLNEHNNSDLLNSLLFLKLHMKERFLFKGKRVVQKKYINLWPETSKVISESHLSSFRKKVMSLSAKHKNITLFILFIYSIYKSIQKKRNIINYFK